MSLMIIYLRFLSLFKESRSTGKFVSQLTQFPTTVFGEVGRSSGEPCPACCPKLTSGEVLIFGAILPSSDRGPVAGGQLLEHSLLSAHLPPVWVIDGDQKLLIHVAVSLYNMCE